MHATSDGSFYLVPNLASRTIDMRGPRNGRTSTLAVVSAGIVATFFAFRTGPRAPWAGSYDELAFAKQHREGRSTFRLLRNANDASQPERLDPLTQAVKLGWLESNWSIMREINIKLFRNDDVHDWSMEINGRFHEHISTEGLTDLVESALVVAAKSLIQSSVHVEHSKAAERPCLVAR
jgi:hypothetical protein